MAEGTPSSISAAEIENEFQGRFEWRRKRWLENMAELHSIAHWGGPDTIRRLPALWGFDDSDPLYALKHSIMAMWLEAVECYIFGQFQACLLTCRATVERALKYEYQKLNGVGLKGHWALGKCIHEHELDGRLDPYVIKLARDILNPGNSRAHALLEHDDPDTAFFGSDRGVYQLTPQAYLIEYYRGDAREVIKNTFAILDRLYGTKSAEDNSSSQS